MVSLNVKVMVMKLKCLRKGCGRVWNYQGKKLMSKCFCFVPCPTCGGNVPLRQRITEKTIGGK